MKEMVIKQVAHEASFASRVRSAVEHWLQQRNELFSSILEERVTHRQALSASHFFLSVMAALAAVQDYQLALPAFVYVFCAYRLAKKGGAFR